ncbi:MAG: DUF1566 domain-containing protein [Planctomycetota bacterium]
MSGCPGVVSWADRDTLCAPGWSACSAAAWVAGRAGQAPSVNYWTDDDLRFTGPESVCFVDETVGSSCNYPMRVCATSPDFFGNTCNWLGCGYQSPPPPSEFFGGCNVDPTAGTLCCRTFVPGDVNSDGIFDVADSTVLRRALADLPPGITQDVLCGNGVLDAGEECDSGVTCADLGFSFGSLDCGAGCAADVNTCTNDRFVDNGDGTVSDNRTGLMWEKKVPGGGCLHCVDDLYDWTDAMSEWISEVNGLTGDPDAQAGLGGHTDWRLPTIVELQTILLEPFPCGTNPCIDSIFGPTASFKYWSSTTIATPPFFAWGVSFGNGGVRDGLKGLSAFLVRGVRGGL